MLDLDSVSVISSPFISISCLILRSAVTYKASVLKLDIYVFDWFWKPKPNMICFSLATLWSSFLLLVVLFVYFKNDIIEDRKNLYHFVSWNVRKWFNRFIRWLIRWLIALFEQCLMRFILLKKCVMNWWAFSMKFHFNLSLFVYSSSM